FKGSYAGSGHRRRMRGGKQERPSAMIEEVDRIAVRTDVAAQGSNRFRKRAHLNVNPAVQVKMIHRSAPVASEYAGRMRVINHHDTAVLLRQFHQSRKGSNIAVHGKHAVANKKLAAFASFQ